MLLFCFCFVHVCICTCVWLNLLRGDCHETKDKHLKAHFIPVVKYGRGPVMLRAFFSDKSLGTLWESKSPWNTTIDKNPSTLVYHRLWINRTTIQFIIIPFNFILLVLYLKHINKSISCFLFCLMNLCGRFFILGERRRKYFWSKTQDCLPKKKTFTE